MSAPGAQAMRLIADGRVVWIMRELTAEPLRAVDLHERIGNIPHTTLLEKLDLLVRSGVVRREERGGRAAGVLQHLNQAGYALLGLVDWVLHSGFRSDPTAPQLFFGTSPPALRALADDSTPELLLALAGPPKQIASLERSSSQLTRSQLSTRLKALELAGFVEKDKDRHSLSPRGREAAGFLLAAAKIEEIYGLSEASPARPSHVASLLSLAAPLAPPPSHGEDILQLDVEPNPGDGQCESVTCLVFSRIEASLTTELSSYGGHPSSASARGPVGQWCAALVSGDLGGLRFGGEGDLARGLVTDLHERLFTDGVRIANS